MKVRIRTLKNDSFEIEAPSSNTKVTNFVFFCFLPFLAFCYVITLMSIQDRCC